LACGFCVTFGQSFGQMTATNDVEDWGARHMVGGAMQLGHVGGIGDFGKFALLRHLMRDRRLAVCCYLTSENDETKDRERHFDYLKHPDDFQHFAPELFDRLAEFDGGRRGVADPLTELQTSKILGNAVFIRKQVPKRVSLRRLWVDELVASVHGANLVFLDPDHGIQGKRLTNRHVALAEIAALRLPNRALIISHHQSGRRSEVKFLADRMRSLGCDPVEIIRLRLVTSRLYVITGHDSAMSELTAAFARKWGNRVKSYRGLAQVPVERRRVTSAEARDTV
jgi:hypothetical protein